MKKGKIVSKRHIVLGVLILALSAAVWLNMRYSSVNTNADNTSSSGKNLGDSIYVDANASAIDDAVDGDYFQIARNERNKTRKEALEVLDSTINNVKTDEQTRKSAVDAKTELAMRMERESSIETLIKAKGFADVVAIIADEGVNVIVKAEELLGSETIQIQDVVLSQTQQKLENIKIVTVK